MNTEPLVDTNVTSGSNLSYWTSSVEPVKYAALSNNIETDVVIVGGGIAGISVALCLLKSGKKVVLVEDGFIGSGETGRTTAHLASALDDRYYDLQRIFGKDGARLAAESHSAAVDFIERTIKEENIDCDFERLSGYLFLHASDEQKTLEKEFAAAKESGLDVRMLDEVPDMMNTVSNCIEFTGQGQFHPMKYLTGLCAAIERMGGKIFTETHADKIDETGITTKQGFTVKAAHVVVATNTPVNDWFVMHTKQYPYRTYAIAAKITKGRLPKALWWDTGDMQADSALPPYHYVRLQDYNEEYDLLIAGGEDHMTGHAPEDGMKEESRYDKLEAWTKEKFPIEEVVYRWSGQVLEPYDSLGYIGRNPHDKNNVYIVTGDSGNGMTHGTIAGMLLTDLINGNKNEWEKIYSPSRFKLFKSGRTMLKELFWGLKDYIKEYPSKADKVNIASIAKGSADIIEIENDKYGAYRDEDDMLHLVKATCTHMKCIVKWNADEKSWDCPCHGSRFTHEGKVLNGPANTDLFYFKEKDEAAVKAGLASN